MRIKSFSNSVQSKKFLCLPLYSKLHCLTSNFKYATTQGSVLISLMLSQIPVMLEQLPRHPEHQALLQGHGDYILGK